MSDPADAPADPKPAPARASVPEVFSREYVTELRNESQTYRQKLREQEDLVKAAQTALDAAKAEAEGKIKEAATAAQQRVIKAELRAAAKDAGAVDAGDVVALLGTDKVKTDADGNITNATELLDELKKAKPHLFGAASSSSTHKAPADKDPKPKQATEMTDDEYRAARAAMVRG